MKLYIAATPDRYELPMIVADSAAELGRRCGCSAQKVHNEIQRNKHRKARKFYQVTTEYSFYVVEVTDDDGAREGQA